MAQAEAPSAAPAAKPRPSAEADPLTGSNAPATRPRGLKMLMRPIPLLIIALVGGLLGLGIYWAVRPGRASPANALQQALEHLDKRENSEAQELAQKLEDKGYKDQEFPGGVAFVLGVAAFREAAEIEEANREQKYLVATAFLKSAEQLTLLPERRPEWAYVQGVGLHRIGSLDDALPLLKEAFESYPPGKMESGLLLADTHLMTHTRSSAQQALKINTQVVELAEISPDDRDRALLQRARILLALGQRDEAEATLAKVSKQTLNKAGGMLLQAQVLMRENRFREALKLLEPISRDKDTQHNYAAQASLLIAVCAERLGEYENAITYYKRTAERFDKSHEALAARLGAAETLLKMGRNEEALENFAAVLKGVQNPQQFRNHWMTLRKLREAVMDAWNSWVDKHCYVEATSLAELMAPAIPREEASELVARAAHRWAEHLEAETLKLPIGRHPERHAELQARWRRCGRAYADLAGTRQTEASRLAALWTAADASIKGHDYASAAERYTELINLHDPSIVPQALVQRAQAYFNLDHLNEARADLNQLLKNHATDASSFQARYLLGQCQMEENQIPAAEKIWKTLLESPELSPAALEWRKSLLSLGKLHFYAGDAKLLNASNALEAAGSDKSAVARAKEQLQFAYTQFEEANSELAEYCERYPDTAETLEARYLLAKSLQKSSRQYQDRLRSAETDNTRTELRSRLKERLEQAVVEFQTVQRELQNQESQQRIDPLGSVMLQNCYFDIAEAYFALGRYENAISAYSRAAGRMQQRPEALLAYVQIANCYDRLKKQSEAMSTLAQAKILLEQLPDHEFQVSNSRLSKPEWQRWLEWAMKVHQ